MKVEVAHVYRAENGRRYFTPAAAARASVNYRMRKAGYNDEEITDGDGRILSPGEHWTSSERLVRIGEYLAKRMLRTR